MTGYSASDRAVHSMALGHLDLQRSLAGVEDRLYARALERVSLSRPVFVTSLPRAGTTLLLDILVGSGDFASLAYRDMPFVLCPLLWQAASRSFRQAPARRERLHGDGVTIDIDSPEGFEEVLWKAYWPEKYGPQRIDLWSMSDRKAAFESAFRSHVRKVIAVRFSTEPASRRYVSKNNTSVARLSLLAEVFPDCHILIPFRDPLSQAISLARQHRNFLLQQSEDSFVGRYMDWIGHYEFGANRRPIAFTSAIDEDPGELAYWTAYWNLAYRHMLAATPEQAIFLDFDRLSVEPSATLERMANALGMPSERFCTAADRIRPPPRSGHSVDLALPDSIMETYAALRARAL
ncbi:MAG TPA: sulfotransferase [Rhizomicrobium sp.]|jgi:hypothetical protein